MGIAARISAVRTSNAPGLSCGRSPNGDCLRWVYPQKSIKIIPNKIIRLWDFRKNHPVWGTLHVETTATAWSSLDPWNHAEPCGTRHQGNRAVRVVWSILWPKKQWHEEPLNTYIISKTLRYTLVMNTFINRIRRNTNHSQDMCSGRWPLKFMTEPPPETHWETKFKHSQTWLVRWNHSFHANDRLSSIIYGLVDVWLPAYLWRTSFDPRFQKSALILQSQGVGAAAWNEGVSSASGNWGGQLWSAISWRWLGFCSYKNYRIDAFVLGGSSHLVSGL